MALEQKSDCVGKTDTPPENKGVKDLASSLWKERQQPTHQEQSKITPDPASGSLDCHTGDLYTSVHDQPATASARTAVAERPADSTQSADSLTGHSRKVARPTDTAEHSLDRSSPARDRDLTGERQHLKELIERPTTKLYGITDQMKKDMEAFEQRMKGNPEKIRDTYHEISRLLEADPSCVNGLDKIKLAMQILHHAARPTDISQGYHQTCNVTSLEVRTFSQNPQMAAKLVVDVATTGRYTAADGTKVTISQESLRPHDEAKGLFPEDGKRDFASQLFEVTAVNIHYAKKDPSGKYTYEQVDPIPGTKPPDTGERLLYKGQEILDKKTGRPIREPHLNGYNIVEIANALSGRTEKDVVLCYSPGKSSKSDSTGVIKSKEELNNKLAELARDGKLPVIVAVDTARLPLLGGGVAGGSGEPHAVTIVGYKPGNPPKVELDNQWASEWDHLGENSISLDAMFTAMGGRSEEWTEQTLENEELPLILKSAD